MVEKLIYNTSPKRARRSSGLYSIRTPYDFIIPYVWDFYFVVLFGDNTKIDFVKNGSKGKIIVDKITIP